MKKCSRLLSAAVVIGALRLKLPLTVVISNTDISKYPLISNNIVWTYFLFVFIFHQLLLSYTTDILKVGSCCFKSIVILQKKKKIKLLVSAFYTEISKSQQKVQS